VTSSADRYAAELRQGSELAAADADLVWGWGSPAGRLRADRRAAFLVERCALGPGVRCLELGAGTGVFTERLLRSGCELVAVELSPATAQRCRERVRGRAEVVVGNVETGEGLEGRSFDAIVGVSVLHHVDLAATLASTFSLLRPGGRFAFTEPNILNPQVWAERNVPWVARRRHTLPHERAFTAAGLRRAFEEARLVVDEARPFEFLHPATPPSLIRPVRRLERLLERTPARHVAGSVRIAGRRPPSRPRS
jgi:SAM-dependent methyltransferase